MPELLTEIEVLSPQRINMASSLSVLPACARVDSHAWVVFEYDIAILVEVEQSDGRHGIWYATGRWNISVDADGVDHALDCGMV